MKLLKIISLRRSGSIALSVGLLLACQGLSASESPGPATKTGLAVIDIDHQNEAKAALARIDSDLDHLQQLKTSSSASATLKAELRVQEEAFQKRRDALEKNYTRGGYEALRADLKVVMDKMNARISRAPVAKPVSNPVVTITTTHEATVGSASEKIADYRTDASDVNKIEAKAALDHLDHEIDLLDAKIEAISDSTRKAQLKPQLTALKARRSELNTEFRKARYDALVEDVKAEWAKVTNAP